MCIFLLRDSGRSPSSSWVIFSRARANSGELKNKRRERKKTKAKEQKMVKVDKSSPRKKSTEKSPVKKSPTKKGSPVKVVSVIQFYVFSLHVSLTDRKIAHKETTPRAGNCLLKRHDSQHYPARQSRNANCGQCSRHGGHGGVTVYRAFGTDFPWG